MRVPDLSSLDASRRRRRRSRTAAERWQASPRRRRRGHALQHRTRVGRAAAVLGDAAVDEITPQDVAALVAELHAEGTQARDDPQDVCGARRWCSTTPASTPNPARDKLTVRLPREERPEINPPTAEHVLEAVHRLLPPRYRLPLLVLDATGMRLGELEPLTWGDVDEPRRPLARLAGRREDRTRPLGAGAAGAVRGRHARSCRATTALPSGGSSRGSAATASAPRSRAPAPPPASRRSRRTISATAGSRCCTLPVCRGRGSASTSASATSRVTANTYSHVLADEHELDYETMLK